MQQLKQQLNDAGYICHTSFAASIKAALHSRPVAGAILEGPIGTGKSYLPEVLSTILDTNYFFYQCFPGTREEDLLVKMLPSEETTSGVALHDGVIIQAVRSTLHSEKKVILVLDEWDKTRPSADSFLLDFLQTGRINFSGREYTADLSRLTVFITVNNERELSEPLVRRLPKIQFSYLPPSQAHAALSLTHAEHPFLYNAIVLYERCLLADLPKPATIQELRQFLDAISTLGEHADWDTLVFQFITKTEEAHELLRKAEKEAVRWRERARLRLDANAYDVRQRSLEPDAHMAESVGMPRLATIRSFDDMLDVPAGLPDLAASAGIVELNDTVYNEVVRLADTPSDTPTLIGDFAEVTAGRFINFTKEFSLRNLGKLSGLWGQNGEVCIVEPRATWEDMKALQDWAPVKVVKFSNTEILVKSDGVDIRWKAGSGAEIIVNLRSKDVFNACFGMGWGNLGEARWIGQKGCIFRRYLEDTDDAA